jgi:beta-glucosidase-like glycosyl hydrolase
MGKLTTYRDKRAELKAHAAALKSTAMTEAKLAAKETREKAKEAHRVELAEAKERAKLARRNADRKAKREERRAKKMDKLSARSTKRDRKAEKALAKQERVTLKREAELLAKDRKLAEKIDAAGRKHEYQLAEMELKKLDGTKVGKEDLQRWLGLAKIATPVLLPMVYKLVSNAQPSDKPGAGAVDLQAAGINATGPGAALGVRIVRLEQTLDQLATTRGDEREVTDFIAATRARLKDLRAAVEAAEITPTAQRREVHASISGELDRINRDVFARLGVKA